MKRKTNIPYTLIKIAWIAFGLYILISFLLGISGTLAGGDIGSAIELVILIIFGGLFLGVYIIITILFLLGKWIFKKRK
jgi:hypothetical protein